MTDDIEKRINEHNKGSHATRSTLGRGPFQLIHVEVAEGRKQARLLEKYFKSGAGREIREEIINTWWM